MNTTLIIILVVAAVVVVALIVVAVTASRRRALRQRFGPEYDRVVADADSKTAAEREPLRARDQFQVFAQRVRRPAGAVRPAGLADEADERQREQQDDEDRKTVRRSRMHHPSGVARRHLFHAGRRQDASR